MSAAAQILGGVPPAGLGLYIRDAIDPRIGRFVALNAARSDLRAQATVARARGQEVWLYSMPSEWRPGVWRDSIASIGERARAIGAVGVIADPENGWPELSATVRRRELAELGAALAAAAASTRVGVTSYPMLPDLRSLADGCGTRVFGSPQLYGRTATDAPTLRGWYDRWRDAGFGPRLVPSIAAWASSSQLETPEGYRRYLDALPRAGGAIGWRATGPMQRHIAAALASYEPGGSAAGTAALAAAAGLGSPWIAGLVVLLAVVVVGGLLAAKGA
jgi:hypothetical protein